VRRYGPGVVVNPAVDPVVVNPANPVVVNPGPRVVGVAPAAAAVISPVVVNRLIQEKKPVELTPQGETLLQLLNTLDVEHHWLAGQPIDWRTGDPLTDSSQAFPLTNDSAFVAAVANRLGLPFLEPKGGNVRPARQLNWLQKEGVDLGWQKVNPVQAQWLANQGWLVVAGWRGSQDQGGRGHVAVIRPTPGPLTTLTDLGPHVTQAAAHNANDTTVKQGFPEPAWEGQKIVYLAHPPVGAQ
jgi:hypothetical protein